MVGLRAIDDDESEYILNNKITSLSGCEFGDIQDKVKNFKNVYIHLDLDVLDKSEFEFTLSPTRNGFSVTAVAELIKKLKESNNVVGFCITESTATNLEQLNKIKPILDQIEL
jgi:arginase